MAPAMHTEIIKTATDPASNPDVYF